MALHFNKTLVTVKGNQGTTQTAFNNAYIPAINFGLKIIIPNQQPLQKLIVDFVLHEIVNGMIQPSVRDRQTLLAPIGEANLYSPSARFTDHPNFYVHSVNITPEVSINGSVDISTLCYHL